MKFLQGTVLTLAASLGAGSVLAHSRGNYSNPIEGSLQEMLDWATDTPVKVAAIAGAGILYASTKLKVPQGKYQPVHYQGLWEEDKDDEGYRILDKLLRIRASEARHLQIHRDKDKFYVTWPDLKVSWLDLDKIQEGLSKTYLDRLSGFTTDSSNYLKKPRAKRQMLLTLKEALTREDLVKFQMARIDKLPASS